MGLRPVALDGGAQVIGEKWENQCKCSGPKAPPAGSGKHMVLDLVIDAEPAVSQPAVDNHIVSWLRPMLIGVAKSDCPNQHSYPDYHNGGDKARLSLAKMTIGSKEFV